MAMTWEGLVLTLVGMSMVCLFLLFLVSLTTLSAKLFEGSVDQDTETTNVAQQKDDGAVVAAIVAVKLQKSV